MSPCNPAPHPSRHTITMLSPVSASQPLTLLHSLLPSAVTLSRHANTTNTTLTHKANISAALLQRFGSHPTAKRIGSFLIYISISSSDCWNGNSGMPPGQQSVVMMKAGCGPNTNTNISLSHILMKRYVLSQAHTLRT